MFRSTTPSPTKSPHRQALSSKDANIRQDSPALKLSRSSTPQLSPSRVVKASTSSSRAASKSNSVSPVKPSSASSLRNSSRLTNNSGISNSISNSNNSIFTKPVPQLGFKIFEDSTDYSTEQRLSCSLAISDENDFTSNKENLAPRSPMSGIASHNRKPLGDLSIDEYAGYITYHSKDCTNSSLTDPKRGVYQLDTLWRLDGTVVIPSYVTPPRFDRVKYISFTQDKVKMKRSNSQSDLKEKVVKKLMFDIHMDDC
ncbi:CYFA0S15e02652g1_1 [Cyberlindnera fabianii]|uniref:CYFA0S15e02652g1_1 n=1 Tax=Cyberlindnera fabianii TaxID=36022 RepID=A0A061BCT3_CYBFA|nr:CYFA0S15e02652g1_1 [Cyberlindnera fabianii]